MSELMTYEESLEENLKATIATRELDLKLKAFENGHEVWLATLNKIAGYFPENSEAREWWGERRDRFADAIYADLICQFSELETFDAYLSRPIHEWSFPEVFQVDWQLQLDADGRWRWWKLGADGSMQKFFRLEQSLWFQQHQSDGNELDLSVDQITHLSDIRQQVSEEAYAIPDLKQSQYHAIALKHITHAWNDVLLPRQRDMIVELMRERCRTMAGPLEVLFRPELDDKTKEAIRKEFESCRKQLLEIEAQLMADLLSALKKELNIPNLITGQARPKYLQPSLCLLELHLIKHGRLPQPKSEIE
ncbi:MAG: hypothetical protein Q8M16_01765 [Pirellulaceae bacterium]|nr:hypothetical protein [Pirellulaceae bacterium]